MNALENFQRNALILLVTGMVASFGVGMIISNNLFYLKIQRNSAEQKSNISLTVVDKVIKNELISLVPTQHYLVLSNGERLYVSREDYEKYEVNQSYNFELLEQIYITHRIKPYSTSGT